MPFAILWLGLSLLLHFKRRTGLVEPHLVRVKFLARLDIPLGFFVILFARRNISHEQQRICVFRRQLVGLLTVGLRSLGVS